MEQGTQTQQWDITNGKYVLKSSRAIKRLNAELRTTALNRRVCGLSPSSGGLNGYKVRFGYWRCFHLQESRRRYLLC
jgi:hypothetical protein